MTILMQIASQFMPAITAGEAQRYGCLIKDVATGRILGHLKEVGSWTSLVARMPLNPLSTVIQIGQWLDTHQQLGAIRQTLSQLQLISSVGAVASVAGLGVSVAGFAVVLSRLNRLESNVQASMEKIRVEVEKVRLKLDMLEMAELRSAWERFSGSRESVHHDRSVELLKDTDQIFQKYRNYYYSLIREVRPLEKAEVSIPAVRELFGRLLACGQAELEANLLLGDFRQWHFRHRQILAQLAEVFRFERKEVFRARATGYFLDTERDLLLADVVMTSDFCRESLARIETANEEVRWLEAKGMKPSDYIASFDRSQDVGIVMIPHSEA